MTLKTWQPTRDKTHQKRLRYSLHTTLFSAKLLPLLSLASRGILVKKEPPLLASSLPYLWNKGHLRDLYQTCSTHRYVTELPLGWAQPVSNVTSPTARSLQSKGLMGRAQGSSKRVGPGTKETNYLMKDPRSLIHRMWAFTCQI